MRNKLADKIKTTLFFLNRICFSFQFHSKNHENDSKIILKEVPNFDTAILADSP
jgi:hypothetical protein